jgi:hypothetical protein
MKTIHILNGDATLNIFKETNIEGDILVWREILAEGPVSKTDLWAVRSKYICNTFGGNAEDYAQGVINEAERLKHLNDYDEIVLWFEYDLVCQINLTYILSVLNQTFEADQIISLICPDHIEGLPNFKGLGELNAEQLKQLLPTKVALQKSDLELATEVWDLYVENDPTKINAYLGKDFGNLSLLKKALKAHLLRFPKAGNQLNYIDEVLLDIINSGTTSKTEIYNQFWAKEPIFGMGDLQLDYALNKLQERGLIKDQLEA